jgi:hypothetical protein
MGVLYKERYVNNNQLKTVSDYLLDEQEFFGYRAPFLFWVSMAGAVAFMAAGAVWVHGYNKKYNRSLNATSNLG